MRPAVWIGCRDYFFFAQQDLPSVQAGAALCAQPLIPTARIAVMMTMRFFMGWF